MNFEFFGAHILFLGAGEISQLGSLAKSYGKRCLSSPVQAALMQARYWTPLAEQGIILEPI